jgi:hypothetical protein
MPLTAEQERRRQELLQELDQLEQRGRPSVRRMSTTPISAARKLRSVRDVVLDALEEIGCTTYTQQLVLYVKARYGRDIQSARFGTLSADEESAFARGASRTVWLCHGLTFDRAEPVKRLWARSDWSIESRIVTPAFGRLQFLLTSLRFCELAMRADEIAANPSLLRYLAADHASELGVPFKRGEFPLEAWRDAAKAQLVEAEQKESSQAAIADRWRLELSRAEQLFGRKAKPVLIAVPNERQA